ncbi:hypothetical protein PMIN06_000067 [Paraphaeosphaeria minitans]
MHLHVHPGRALDGTLHVVSALRIDAESIDRRSSRLLNRLGVYCVTRFLATFDERDMYIGYRAYEQCKALAFRFFLSCGSFSPFFSSLLVFEESRHFTFTSRLR